MKKVYLRAAVLSVVVFIFLAILFRVWWNRSQSSVNQENLVTLDKMETNGLPDFSSTTLDGNKISLSQHKGKIVILNFWASWCGPCIEEIPSLIKLVQEMNGDVQLIAVSGDNSLDDITSFLKSYPEMKNPNIHIIFDSDKSIMKLYGIDRLPESLVANRSQKLIKKIIGTINWYNPDSLEYLKSVKD